MGYRDVDAAADYSGAGLGYFGTDRFFPASGIGNGLEFLNLFGSNYPDKRLKDRWDYALNDRLARNVNMPLLADSARQTDTTANAYYQLGASAADLGPQLTIFTVFKRSGPNPATDAAWISSFGGGGYSLTLGAAGGNYQAFMNNVNDTTAKNVSIPYDAATGAVFELGILVIRGDGTAHVEFRRPPGYATLSSEVTELPAGLIWSAARPRSGGQSFGGGFKPGDYVAAVGGYRRALTASDISALHIALRGMLGEYNGAVI